MTKEQSIERYLEAFDAFSDKFKNTNIVVKHRSMKKFEDGTNRDISFYHQDKYICGVYVAKDKYKFYLDNDNWFSSSKGQVTERKEDGWYNCFFEDLDDCISDVNRFFEVEILK